MSYTSRISILRTEKSGWKLSPLVFAWILLLDLGAQSFDSCWQAKISGEEPPDSDQPGFFEQGAFGQSGMYQIRYYNIDNSDLETPVTISSMVSDRLVGYQNALNSEIINGNIRCVIDPPKEIDGKPGLSKSRILILFMNPPFGYNQEHLFYFSKEEDRFLSVEIILDNTRCSSVENIDEAVRWKFEKLQKR